MKIFPNTPISFINISIVIQMIVIIFLLFRKKLSPKENFVPRFVFFNFVSYLFACNITYYFNNIVFEIFVYISIFLTQLIAVRFCYKEQWYTVFFVTAAAKIIEHITSMLYAIVTIIDLKNLNFTYGAHWNYKTTFIYPGISVLLYLFVYYIMVKPMNMTKGLKVKSYSLIIFVITSIFITIIMNLYFVSFVPFTTSLSTLLILYILSALCGVLILLIQFGMFNSRDKEKQLEIISELWNQSQKQYRMSKENIDAINLKNHNLKHRILEFKHTKEFEDIITDIDIFDANINTYNVVLNIILTEKSIFCKKNDIQFSCFADGKLISFMDKTDIYVLFGNIIDNAINAVSSLKILHEKNIHITIERKNNFILILTENNYSGKLVFKNNLPISGEKNIQHGFGMLSIKNIVEKYDGYISIKTQNNIFALNILIPIKKI